MSNKSTEETAKGADEELRTADLLEHTQKTQDIPIHHIDDQHICLTSQGETDEIFSGVINANAILDCANIQPFETIPVSDPLNAGADLSGLELTLDPFSVNDGGECSSTTQGEIERHLFCEPCLIEEEQNEVFAFCLKCIEYLCRKCLKDHKKNKMTRDHMCLQDEDMPSSKKPFEMIKNYGMCKTHTNMDLKYICVDHNECVCTECERMFHRKCEKIDDIETLENDTKEGEPASTFISKVVNSIKEVSNQNMISLTNIKTLQDDSCISLDDIDKAYKHAIVKIENLKYECQETTNKVNAEHVKDIKQLIDVRESIIRDGKEMKQVMQVAMKYASRRQIKIITKLMEEQHSAMMTQIEPLKRSKQMRVKFSEKVEMFTN